MDDFAQRPGMNAGAGVSRLPRWRGMGGWLLFYLVFQGLSLVREVLGFPFWDYDQLENAAFIGGIYIPFMIVAWVFMAAALALVVFRKRVAIGANVIALALKIIGMLLNVYGLWGTLQGAAFYMGLPMIGISAAIHIAWMAYFLRSRRVKEILNK